MLDGNSIRRLQRLALASQCGYAFVNENWAAEVASVGGLIVCHHRRPRGRIEVAPYIRAGLAAGAIIPPTERGGKRLSRNGLVADQADVRHGGASIFAPMSPEVKPLALGGTIAHRYKLFGFTIA